MAAVVPIRGPVRERTGTRPARASGTRGVACSARSPPGSRMRTSTAIASSFSSCARIYAVVAVALALTSGFTGVFSLGQIGFLAIGAYVSALLSMPPMVKQPMLLPGLPEWLATFDSTGWHPQAALLFACIVSGLVAALVGALVGAPLMRLSGNYVAVATMGFLIIVHSIAVNWDEVTRGARGLSQIPTYDESLGGLYLGRCRGLRRAAAAQLTIRPGNDRLAREPHRVSQCRGQRLALAAAGLRRQRLPDGSRGSRCWLTRSGPSRRAGSTSRRHLP